MRGRTSFRPPNRVRPLLLVIGVAALVVATLLYARALGDRAEKPPAPSPPSEPRIAPRDAAVWADDDGIHVGGQLLEPAVPPRSLTLVEDGVVYLGASGTVWYQRLADGFARQLGTAARWTAPVGYADGDLVAWAARAGGGRYEFVVHDVQRDVEVARWPAIGGLERFHPFGGDRIANHGPVFSLDRYRLHYVGGGGAYVLDLRTGVAHRLAGERTAAAASRAPGDFLRTVDAAYDLRVVQVCCSEEYFRSPLAFVNARGRVLRTFGAAEPTGVLSHDWARFADVVDGKGRSHHVEVVDVATGRTRALTRDGDAATQVGWGYGDVLVVAERPIAPATSTRLLACNVRTFACSTLPSGASVLLPAS